MIHLGPKSNVKCPYKRKTEGDLRQTEQGKTQTHGEMETQAEIEGSVTKLRDTYLEPPAAENTKIQTLP